MGRRRDRRGGSAVEFALVALPLMMVITASLDYGWYFVNSHVLHNVAHHASRVAASTPQDEDPEAAGEAAGEAKWAAMGLPGEVIVAVSRGGDPEVVRVRASVAGPHLVGLVPTPDEVSFAVQRRMEEQPREDDP
jgi:Flp pilus assembly protein TadG